MKKRKKYAILAMVSSILLIVGLIYIAISRADLITLSFEVEPDTELTYYLKLKYDGKDKFGVESNGTTTANVSSDIIYIEDVIPEGLTFIGFVPSVDGTIGAVETGDDGTSCPGNVIDDTEETSLSEGTWNEDNTEYTYHGLHYTTSDRTVRFRVKNLKAGCFLTVGIITKTPATIDDPSTAVVELRRDFYNHAIGRERDVITKSNIVHAYMGTGTLYKVKYAFSGLGPDNMVDLLPDELEYAENSTVRVEADPPTIDGWEFQGWNCKNDTMGTTLFLNNRTFSMPSSDVTCTGSWTKNNNTYTVTYQIDGTIPDGYILPSTKTYYEGDIVVLDSRKPNSVFNGYTFKGWTSEDVTLDDSYEFTMPNKNVIIKGSFEKKKYKVIYEFLNYKTELESLIPPEEEHLPGDTVKLPTITEPTGYHFLGWYKDDNFTMPEEDITIYGEWMESTGCIDDAQVYDLDVDLVGGGYTIGIGDTLEIMLELENNESYPITNVQVRIENTDVIFPEDNTQYTKLSDKMIEVAEIPANSTVIITFEHTIKSGDVSPFNLEVTMVSALATNKHGLCHNDLTQGISFELDNTLEICKKVDGVMPNPDKKFDFIVSGENNTYNLSLKKDECKTLKGLSAGTYSITEVETHDYEIKSVSGAIPANGRDLVLLAGANYKVTFTNTFRKKGFWHAEGRADNEVLRLSTAVTRLFNSGDTSLSNDDPDNNIRYIGATPNNYVQFNGDELWRIVGVFNVNDGNYGIDKRVKLIKEEPIGRYSYDSSVSDINGGYGINEWSQADLMTELNGDYLNTSLSTNTKWFGNSNNTKDEDFDYTSVLKDTSQSLIGNALWYLGSPSNNNGEFDRSYAINMTPETSYRRERSTFTGKTCSSEYVYGCNDGVERTSRWTGKVALMYLSDYGYATSGGTTADRTACLATGIYNWYGDQYGDCTTNNWLYKTDSYQWLLSPMAHDTNAYSGVRIHSNGRIYLDPSYAKGAVRPVVYLKPEVIVYDGEGTDTNPYKIK